MPTPQELSFDLSPAYKIALDVRFEMTAEGLNRLEMTIRCDRTIMAIGNAALPSAMVLKCVQGQRLVKLKLINPNGGASAGKGSWSLAFLAATDEPLIQIIERCAASLPQWTLDFPGNAAFTHRQLLAVPAVIDSTFRFGAFSQHGQLFDFKDWFAVADNEQSTVVGSLRPGNWTPQARLVPQGRVLRDGVSLTLPLAEASAGQLRRTYFIAWGRTKDVVANQPGLPATGEIEEPYVAWASRRIARYGFARPERLASYARQAGRLMPHPTPPCVFGPAAFELGLHRVAADHAWANGHAFWEGDYEKTWTWASEALRRFRVALESSGYLHPLGNPVSARVLAPAAATIHLLDCAGRLPDERRHAAAEDVAVLAELLIRRDFYPHHFATRPPEWPPLEGAFYRGMLNENFNTDRYAFVGMCGCVLPHHPHAPRWRRHFVEQFREQMRAFVHRCGAWEESHTYANHVKLVLLPVMMAMRHAAEAIDLTVNPAFRAFARFFVPLLSPPDALLNGRRGIPAIGDHGYGKHGDYGFLFGWLAEALPDLAEEFRWAWQETGCQHGEASPQINTYSAMFSPERRSLPALMPGLDGVRMLDGYGASARRAAGTERESLLVVRCGRTWGHYHADQGSFWWWVDGQLIACDADLGDGPFKFDHAGHNVLGYPGRNPSQFLDYEPYQIEQLSGAEPGSVEFRCQIPVPGWHIGHQQVAPIARDQRPQNTRAICWNAEGDLKVTDMPVRSPGERVMWSLHVPTQQTPRWIDSRTLAFPLGRRRRLLISLSNEPLETRLEQSQKTWGVHIEYRQATISHRLRVV